MRCIHAHLRVEISQCEAVHEQRGNGRPIPALNIQEGPQVWNDAQHVRTIKPVRNLDRTQLGPIQMVHSISTYAYELELPASIRIHRVQPTFLLNHEDEDPSVGQEACCDKHVETID